MMIHLPAGSLGATHQVQIKLKYPDQAATIVQIDIAISVDTVPGANPGEGINVPQVIDLSPIAFAQAGQVDVQVSVDDEPVGDLTFWMLQA